MKTNKCSSKKNIKATYNKNLPKDTVLKSTPPKSVTIEQQINNYQQKINNLQQIQKFIVESSNGRNNISELNDILSEINSFIEHTKNSNNEVLFGSEAFHKTVDNLGLTKFNITSKMVEKIDVKSIHWLIGISKDSRMNGLMSLNFNLMYKEPPLADNQDAEYLTTHAFNDPFKEHNTIFADLSKLLLAQDVLTYQPHGDPFENNSLTTSHSAEEVRNDGLSETEKQKYEEKGFTIGDKDTVTQCKQRINAILVLAAIGEPAADKAKKYVQTSMIKLNFEYHVPTEFLQVTHVLSNFMKSTTEEGEEVISYPYDETHCIIQKYVNMMRLYKANLLEKGNSAKEALIDIFNPLKHYHNYYNTLSNEEALAVDELVLFKLCDALSDIVIKLIIDKVKGSDEVETVLDYIIDPNNL